MYATVRTYSAPGELAAELTRNADSVKSVMSGVPGFRAYYMVDTGDGAVSVTVCDDQAGAEQSNQVAAGWIRENLPELAISPPTISAGEVALGFSA